MQAVFLCLFMLFHLAGDTPKVIETPQYPLGTIERMKFQVSVWETVSVSPYPLLERSQASVCAERPASLRIDLRIYNELRQTNMSAETVTFLGLSHPDLIVTDGKTQLWYSDFTINIQDTFPGVSNLTNVFVAHRSSIIVAPELLFSKDPIKAYKLKYQGIKPFQGGKGYCYLWDKKGEKRPTRSYLYLGLKDRLPLLLSGQSLDRKGEWHEVFREYYSNWQLNPVFSPEVFAVRVPTKTSPENPPK